MSTDLSVTTPHSTLDELKAEFGAVSGLPVVKDRKSMVLVGVVSRKDLLKAGDKVADVRADLSTLNKPAFCSRKVERSTAGWSLP